MTMKAQLKTYGMQQFKEESLWKYDPTSRNIK